MGAVLKKEESSAVHAKIFVISTETQTSNASSDPDPRTFNKALYTMVGLGVFLILIGVTMASLFPMTLRHFLHQNLVLAEGKEAYEKWKKTPIPVMFSVYVFNVTNPDEVTEEGAKPIVSEVGPFVFKQLRSKDVLKWNQEEMTVTYNDVKQYHFMPSLSADLDSEVFMVNLPLQGILMYVKKLGYLVRSFLVPRLGNLFNSYNETLLLLRTPRQLIFDGYKVDLVQDLMDLSKPFMDMPELLPNNTFAFLYGKNNSGDGIFTVYTGEDDISKYSQIKRWGNMSQIPFWDDSYCNMMNGTDGSQFPPPITRRDVLYVYTPDLCRSVFLEFEKDVQVQGIPAYRFFTPERLFASPVDNPDNMCYCTEERYCDLSGILDISPCRKGLKIAATAPHFYQAHPFIAKTVDGLVPNKEKHVTYVDIEPTTGLVLRASRKLQMNFIMETFEELEQTKNAPMAVFPLIWVKEEAEIDSEVAALFTAKVRTPITIAKAVLTACIVLGILWIVTAGFVTVYILMKQQKATKATIKSKYAVVPQKPEDIKKNDKMATTT